MQVTEYRKERRLRLSLMMMERSSVSHPPLGQPPGNELPAIVPAPDVIWRGDGTVLAVPLIAVYTSGIELHVLYRTSVTYSEVTAQARRDSEILKGITVNGRNLTLLHGSYYSYGFNYRVWQPFMGPVPDSLALALEWPGTSGGLRSVSGIHGAADRIAVLW